MNMRTAVATATTSRHGVSWHIDGRKDDEAIWARGVSEQDLANQPDDDSEDQDDDAARTDGDSAPDDEEVDADDAARDAH